MNLMHVQTGRSIAAARKQLKHKTMARQEQAKPDSAAAAEAASRAAAALLAEEEQAAAAAQHAQRQQASKKARQKQRKQVSSCNPTLQHIVLSNARYDMASVSAAIQPWRRYLRMATPYTMMTLVAHGLPFNSQTAVWMQAKRAELQPSNQPPSDAAAHHDTQPSAASSAVPRNDALQPAPTPASTAGPSAAADGPDPDLAHLSLQDKAATSRHASSIHAAADQPQAQADDTEDLEEAECVICWEAPASVVLQPCGHMCACSGCIGLLTDLPCPMCRRDVTSSTHTAMWL